MKLINKQQLITYYTDGADDDTKEYIINMLVKMPTDEFNAMVEKDYNGFIIPYQQKGYYIEN